MTDNIDHLVAQRDRLSALYWQRSPGWTRAGDVLHKYAVKRRLATLDAHIEALRKKRITPP